MARRKLKGKRVSPLEALAQLNRALSATPEREAARQAVLDRYARKLRSGKPMLCTPKKSELLMDRVPGAFKVIFDDEDTARQAAAELSLIGGPPMTPYLCPQSRSGHAHLKTVDAYRSEKDC